MDGFTFDFLQSPLQFMAADPNVSFSHPAKIGLLRINFYPPPKFISLPDDPQDFDLIVPGDAAVHDAR